MAHVNRRWGWRDALDKVGCLEKPGVWQEGRLGTGAGRSLGRPRQWGTSHRWPFDLTTNGLFSISEMGPDAGSQGRMVARHRGLPAWFHG